MWGRVLLGVRVGVVVVVRPADAEAGLVGLAALHGDPVPVEGAGSVLDGFATNARIVLDVHVRIISGNGIGESRCCLEKGVRRSYVGERVWGVIRL